MISEVSQGKIGCHAGAAISPTMWARFSLTMGANGSGQLFVAYCKGLSTEECLWCHIPDVARALCKITSVMFSSGMLGWRYAVRAVVRPSGSAADLGLPSCMYAYFSMHTCMFVCMHVCMHACTHVRMYACLSVCPSVWLFVYVCLYVCMYVCMVCMVW